MADTTQPTWRTDLRALADILRRLADGPAADVVVPLGDFTDTSSPEHLTPRLRQIRRHATVEAVADAGGQRRLSELLGLSETAIHRARKVESRPRPERVRQPAV